MAELDRFFVKWENSNYRSNFAASELSIFLKFFWCTPNYTLSLENSSCQLASGGTSNVKIIESPLL